MTFSFKVFPQSKKGLMIFSGIVSPSLLLFLLNIKMVGEIVHRDGEKPKGQHPSLRIESTVLDRFWPSFKRVRAWPFKWRPRNTPGTEPRGNFAVLQNLGQHFNFFGTGLRILETLTKLELCSKTKVFFMIIIYTNWSIEFTKKNEKTKSSQKI